MENPLVSPGRPLPFAAIQAEHVVPALKALLREAERRLEGLSPERPTFEATLAELEAATERIELAMGIVEHLESVATTGDLREAYNTVLPEVTAFWSSIPLRENVWHALKAFAASDEATGLAPTEKRLLDKTIADFRRHGATLNGPGKEQLSALDRELGLLTTKFSQNVLDSTNAFELLLTDEAALAGLPKSALDAAQASAASKGLPGYRLTLQAPIVTAILTYADDATLRESIWRAHNGRAVAGALDNRGLIADILRLRREKANLLGFRDFADLVIDDRMAKTGAQAVAFVDELTKKTKASFDRENAELADFHRKLAGPAAPPLRPWT